MFHELPGLQLSSELSVLGARGALRSRCCEHGEPWDVPGAPGIAAELEAVSTESPRISLWSSWLPCSPGTAPMCQVNACFGRALLCPHGGCGTAQGLRVRSPFWKAGGCLSPKGCVARGDPSAPLEDEEPWGAVGCRHGGPPPPFQPHHDLRNAAEASALRSCSLAELLWSLSGTLRVLPAGRSAVPFVSGFEGQLAAREGRS
ncbi:hypothetical protein DV515_00019557, partial [Chloebia gouldiae]